MKQLLKWEAKLLLRQKMIYVTAILMVAFMVLSHTVIDTSDQAAFDEQAGPISVKDLEKAEQVLTEIENGTREATVMDNPYLHMLAAKEYSMMEEELQEELSQENTPLAKKELEYREAIDVMYVANYEFPELLIEYTSGNGVIFIGVLLLIGLYPLFSRDETTGVAQYTLTSKYGRSKLGTAKLTVAVLYSVVVYLCVVSVIWLYNLYRASANGSYWTHASKGWDAPVQFLTALAGSPYPLSAGQYHMIQLGILLLGTLTLAVLFVLVSSLCKNSFTSFLVSAGIFFIPIIVVDIAKAVTSIKWLDIIHPYTITYTMKMDALFNSFQGVQIGSFILIGPYIAVILLTLILLTSLRTTKWYVGSKKMI